MCILFVYINPDPQPGTYKVILASNRDEIYKRPAKPSHEWAQGGVYGGIDLQQGKEGGTWLAINKYGRIGVLLNVGQNAKDMRAIDQASRRGFYAVEWVTNMDYDMKGIFEIVKQKHGSCQQNFRLATLDASGKPTCAAGTLTAVEDFEEEILEPGFHAFGNNAPGVTWNKVLKGKEHFENIVQKAGKWDNKEELLDQLIRMLCRKEKHWPDAGITNQMGDSAAIEFLSAIFVDMPGYYGTRTHSVILINNDDQVLFYERTMEGETSEESWTETRHEFNLEPAIAL